MIQTKKNPSQNLGRGMAVGIERRGFMQVTQMWPFSSPSPTDDKLQVWGNRLFGYKKPSIMISVIISSWPRPHSSKVINTCIILLKEIEKCIPDCQRKEFSMIYTEMVLKHFFSSNHPSSRNTKDKYFMNPEVLLASIWRWSWEYKSVILFHHRLNCQNM